MRPDWVLKVKEEVEKQIKAEFLVVTEYHEWVANIVPIMEKRQTYKSVYRLPIPNKGSPNDNFPLSHMTYW